MVEPFYSYFSDQEVDTVRLGQALAKLAQKGDTFALFGTLGMGKSVLARAFVQYFQGEVEVPSPTFTLLQTYETPQYEVYHYDLYRLKSPEEIFELGMEEALYEGVCLIEWPEKMGAYLPKKAIRIEFLPQDHGRQIKFSCQDDSQISHLYSLKDLLK